ncbi:hypothetical protein Tco_0422658, partial [Tanacetum coccineum]
MAWFEQLGMHLRDLYLNSSSHAVDAFKPAFRSFFGEEHQTFRLKMFHNLDQLRQLLERENLLEVNARTCLEALRTQFKEFFSSKRLQSQDGQINPVHAVDDSLSVSKSSWIESEFNNALSKLVNETQLQQHVSLVTESTTLEANLSMDVNALDVGLAVTESNGTNSYKQDTSSSSGTYITHVVDADIRPVNVQVSSAEVHLTAQHNVLANEQQHSDQSKPSYDTYLLEKVNSNTTPDSTNMSHKGGEIDKDAEHDQVQSPKTRNNNKPVEPKSHTQKPSRQIAIGQRLSLNKSSAVHEKPNTPRSCLRWIPTGRIFKLAGLRWIPTGKMFIDSTTKVDSEPPNDSNEDITNPYECDQTLNVSAGLALQRQMASADNTLGPVPQRKESSGPGPQLMTPGYISSRLVQNRVSPTPYVPPSKKDYEILFQPLFDEYFNPPPRVVSLDLELFQNRRDLPRDNPLVSVEVLRYDIKRSKSENKGIVPTEMELVLEQTQQDSGQHGYLKCPSAIYPCEIAQNIELSTKVVTVSNTISEVQYLYCKTVLTEPEDYIEMEMQTPRSSIVKFIATCSYSRLNDFKTSRKNDSKLSQTLISTSSLITFIDLNLDPLLDIPSKLHTTNVLPLHLMPSLKKNFDLGKPWFPEILMILKPDLSIYDMIQHWAPRDVAFPFDLNCYHKYEKKECERDSFERLMGVKIKDRVMQGV